VRCENQRDRPDWDIIATSAMWPCPSQVCGSADKCSPTHRASGTENVDVNFCMFHLGSSRCRRWRLFSNGHLPVVGLLSTMRVPEQRATTPRPTLTTRSRKSSGGKMQPPRFRNSMISSNLPSRPAQRSWPKAFRRASNRYHARSGYKWRRRSPQAHLRGPTPPRDRHHLDPPTNSLAGS
jgi:hypothetical protein